jgi:hypothetical protein
MRRLLYLGAVLLLAGGQGWNRYEPELDNLENIPYNGQFTFARIRYGRGWLGGNWAHDYPRADRHLPQILHDLTTLDPNLGASNVFELEDPAIFEYPMIYVSEPGFWPRMSDEATANLRQYLLKGGFVIFDDFEEGHLYNVEAQLRRALPELRMIQIDVNHPIFHTFFEMKSIEFPHPMGYDLTPHYYGLFEDNDPNRRMLAIINQNSDLAEYWEWSDTGMFPVDFTSEAYKLGVNYVVYSMTH